MQIRYNAIRNAFWSGFNMEIEPRHDKPNKMICAPSEDSDQPGHPPSLISFRRCPPEANLGPKLPSERTAKSLIRLGGCPGWSETLIRLGGCPGWSKASLGTKVILLALSWGGSKCFFLESTYAAHIHFITFFTFCIEPNMKSFSHANNIVLRRDIYIHSLNWC